MAPQKSLEQQLAETRAKQDRIKARLAQLEVRKKAKDQRRRAQGNMTLVKVLLDRAAAHPTFKAEMRALVAEAEALRPQEREAALFVLDTFNNDPTSDEPETNLPGQHVNLDHAVG